MRTRALIAAGLLAALSAWAEEPNRGFLTVRGVLEASCSSCHDWTSSHEGIADPSRVTPGSPDSSPLYTLVASDSMPMGGQPLPAAHKSLLRAWIAAGATASEQPLVLASAQVAPDAVTGATTPAATPSARRFNTVRFHQISGFTSASLFLAAGVIGTVQWATFIADGHAERDRLGIDEYEDNPVCASYIRGLWGDPEHQALRWTHVGLLTAGESLYLANAVTGWRMRTKDRPGLSAQDLHRYAFFTHGTLMLAQAVLGFVTTEVLSRGNHEAMIAVGAAHSAVGLAIPVVMIASGITVNRMLKR